MTTDGAAGRPDVDRLAELDADIAAGLPTARAIPSDPASRAVLDALATTRAELASLPPVPLPAELTARWTAALATAPVDGRPTRGRARKRVPWPPSPRTGRDRSRPPAGPPRARRRTRPAVAVGLALVGLLVAAGVLRSGTAPPAVTAAELGGVASAAVGTHDAGELTDPVRRAGCLRSVAPPGLAPDALLVGGRGVRFEGRPATLLVLASGRLGAFRVLVVDPNCGPGGGTLLADTLVGG